MFSGLPATYDLIVRVASVYIVDDEHNTDGMAEVTKNKDFYHKTIYPKLHAHQQALFVPGVFGCDPVHCAAKQHSCPLDPQAKQIVISAPIQPSACRDVTVWSGLTLHLVSELQGFFEWAKNDTRIAGFNPWHFANRSRELLPRRRP